MKEQINFLTPTYHPTPQPCQQPEDYLYFAKLSRDTLRFDDAIEYVKKALKSSNGDIKLTADQRNLLCMAFRQGYMKRRDILKSLNEKILEIEKENLLVFRKNTIPRNSSPNSMDQDKIEPPSDLGLYYKTAQNYKKKIQSEMKSLCSEAVELLNQLLQHTEANESIVFYRKMEGDYYRYLCEFASGDQEEQLKEKANEAYKTGSIKCKNLPKTSPIALSLALNYSVFMSEVMHSKEQAIAINKEAFEGAIGEIELLDEEEFRDSAKILQILHHNLKNLANL